MVKFCLLKFGPRVSSSISGHGQSLTVGILDNRVMAANCSSNFGKQVPTVVIDLARIRNTRELCPCNESLGTIL